MPDLTFAQTDVLFLLIGANPLPNYVAARLLTRQHAHVFCVLEKETVKGMLLGDALAAGETLATITPG